MCRSFVRCLLLVWYFDTLVVGFAGECVCLGLCLVACSLQSLVLMHLFFVLICLV